jgi:hypothetical protein
MIKIFALNEKVQFFNAFDKQALVGCVYEELNKIEKIIRSIHLKLHLPFYSIWFSKDFKTYGRFENDGIILFDSYLNIPAVHYYKKKFPNSRIIYWFWNHIYDSKILKKLPYGIEMWSYDPYDCEIHDLNFNTQFFGKSIIPSTEDKTIHHDFLFVGAEKGRADLINYCADIIDRQGLTRIFKVIDYRKQKSIPYVDVLKMVCHTRCVVDILPKDQNGLSLRPFEAMFMKKKLITNFKKIKNESFYHPDNIFIIGYDDEDSLKEFLERPFNNGVLDLVEYYELNNWYNRFSMQ